MVFWNEIKSHWAFDQSLKNFCNWVNILTNKGHVCQAQNHCSKMSLQLLAASIIYIFAGPNLQNHVFSNFQEVVCSFSGCRTIHRQKWKQKSISQSSEHSLGILSLINLLNPFLNSLIPLISVRLQRKQLQCNWIRCLGFG